MKVTCKHEFLAEEGNIAAPKEGQVHSHSVFRISLIPWLSCLSAKHTQVTETLMTHCVSAHSSTLYAEIAGKGKICHPKVHYTSWVFQLQVAS